MLPADWLSTNRLLERQVHEPGAPLALLYPAPLTTLAVPRPSTPRQAGEPRNLPLPSSPGFLLIDLFFFPPFFPPCCPLSDAYKCLCRGAGAGLTCCSQISALILCLVRRDKTPTLAAAPRHLLELLSQSCCRALRALGLGPLPLLGCSLNGLAGLQGKSCFNNSGESCGPRST